MLAGCILCSGRWFDSRNILRFGIYSWIGPDDSVSEWHRTSLFYLGLGSIIYLFHLGLGSIRVKFSVLK